MVKVVMGSTKPPRIKRGSRSYHVKSGETFDKETGRYTTEPKTEKSSVDRWAKEKRQRVRKGYRAGVVAARSDASNTAGEKALPRGGGRAKASAARAAATRKKNIAASKKAGTYARTAKNQTERNKARARSDARTRVGGGSPGSRVAGGLARVRGR